MFFLDMYGVLYCVVVIIKIIYYIRKELGEIFLLLFLIFSCIFEKKNKK